MRPLILLISLLSFSAFANTTLFNGTIKIKTIPVCSTIASFETLITVARSAGKEGAFSWIRDPSTDCSFAQVGETYILLEDNSNYSMHGSPFYYKFTDKDGESYKGYTELLFMKSNVNAK